MDTRKETKTMRLGEILVDAGMLTREQLTQALEMQAKDGSRRLGELLVDEGFITERDKLEALSKRLDIPVVELGAYDVDMDAAGRIPREIADKYRLLAIGRQDGALLVAVSDPTNFFAVEEVRQYVKMPVRLCLAESGEIKSVADYVYSEVHARRAVGEANEMAVSLEPELERSTTQDDGDAAPVVKVLNSLLAKGYSSAASDIHIEPFDDKVRVRIRVDGVIVEYTSLSLSLHRPLIARIKILSGLDIAERRAPQDGHFRIDIGGEDVNIRVSVVPTVHGEKAVLRFLSTNTKIDRAGCFGMSRENYEKMMRALRSPHGIVYITGPTGSGKTTTLYMILEYLASRQVNIATIEDPVERAIDKVNQIQVNPLAGLTFESGLRSILRQDPDIIMVGETRDSETASISIRSAITGHLVLSTLHTNDAASAIVRLVDMGIPSYMIASSVVAVMAQRLVRKVCPECGYSYEATEAERAFLTGTDIHELRRGRGCAACSGTGYKGRIAVHEIILIDRELRDRIAKGATSDEIFAYAAETQGAKSLRQSALELLREGITTVEEAVKTTYFEGL